MKLSLSIVAITLFSQGSAKQLNLGQDCSFNKDCKSGICDSNRVPWGAQSKSKCVAASGGIGATCYSTNFQICKPGLRCDTKTSQCYQGQSNDKTPCQDYRDCADEEACDRKWNSLSKKRCWPKVYGKESDKCDHKRLQCKKGLRCILDPDTGMATVLFMSGTCESSYDPLEDAFPNFGPR